MAGQRNKVPRDLVPGFAKTITQARRDRKWSQRELALAAGVSAMCVCEIESEKRSTSLRVAARIVRALGLSLKLEEFATDAVNLPSPTEADAAPEKSKKPRAAKRPIYKRRKSLPSK